MQIQSAIIRTIKPPLVFLSHRIIPATTAPGTWPHAEWVWVGGGLKKTNFCSWTEIIRWLQTLAKDCCHPSPEHPGSSRDGVHQGFDLQHCTLKINQPHAKGSCWICVRWIIDFHVFCHAAGYLGGKNLARMGYEAQGEAQMSFS